MASGNDWGPRGTVHFYELIAVIVLALAAGLAFGAMFHRQLLGDPIPFFVAEHAQAVDGDTIRVTVLLHLDGLDAPEVDRERCAGEMEIGRRARDRAAELLEAGPVRVKILKEDVLGRMGAQIVAADRALGPTLLREGLLQPTEAGRWCPDDAGGPKGPMERLMAWDQSR